MPDTQSYMLLGYGLAFVLLALTVVSLWWRYRSLVADEAALEQLQAEVKDSQTAPAPSEAVRA